MTELDKQTNFIPEKIKKDNLKNFLYKIYFKINNDYNNERYFNIRNENTKSSNYNFKFRLLKEELFEYMYDYQWDFVEKGIENPNIVFQADVVGLGKTLQTLVFSYLEMINKIINFYVINKPNNSIYMNQEMIVDFLRLYRYYLQNNKIDEGVKLLNSRNFSVLKDLFRNQIQGILKRKLNTNILIVCPSPVKRQWKEEIEKFLPSDLYNISTFLHDGKPNERLNVFGSFAENQVKFPLDINFYLVNYELIRTDNYLFKSAYNIVLFDEVHRLKNAKTVTYKTLNNLNSYRKMGLTATPFVNNPVELFNILQFLKKGFISYSEFSNNYCTFGQTFVGKRHPKADEDGMIENIVGYKNLDELNIKLKQIMIRRQRNEVFDQIKKRIYQNFYIELDPIQEKIIKKLQSKGKQKILQFNKKTKMDELMNMVGFIKVASLLCNSTTMMLNSKSDMVREYMSEIDFEIPPKVNVKVNHIIEERLPELLDNDRKTIIATKYQTMAKEIYDSLMTDYYKNGKSTGKSGIDILNENLNEKINKDEIDIITGATNKNISLLDKNLIQMFSKSKTIKSKKEEILNKYPELKNVLDNLKENKEVKEEINIEVVEEEKEPVYGEYDDIVKDIFGEKSLSLFETESVLYEEEFDIVKYVDALMHYKKEGLNRINLKDLKLWNAKNGKTKILIATYSLNYGANLQTMNSLIFYDVPYTPAEMEQFIGRIDRIGQERDMIIIKLITNGTEERILKLLQEKKINFDKTIEGLSDSDIKEMQKIIFNLKK